MKRALALFAASALLGTLCDQIHVQSGVLWYPKPFYPGGQAWWVPLVFGVAGLALVYGAAAITRRMLPAAREGSVWSTFIWFLIAYLLTGLLAQWPTLLLLVLFCGWGTRVFPRKHERTALVVISCATAVIGPLVEGSLSLAGEFFYADADWFGVPRWLPGLYLHAALLGREIARAWFGGR